MFKKKNKQIKTAPNKSNLEQVLWFIENYLPQKKDRGVQKKLYMDNVCLLYTSPSPRDGRISRMPSSA